MSEHQSPLATPRPLLPQPPVQRLLGPLARFFQVQSAGGVVLVICTIVALVLANSRWSEDFTSFWQTKWTIAAGEYALSKPLIIWINDALMTVFFFVVGLEIKRELVAGELREFRKAALPVLAAAGGMIAPAGIFLALRYGSPGESGWGIPMATDIAFVVGFLALLGRRVPVGLKIMLLTLAIADDIGAVLVIAAFYSGPINTTMLALAAGGFVLTYLLNRIGVRRVGIYVLVGAGIWLAVLKSGIHPTVAGVMLGLMTPSSAWIGDRYLYEVIQEALRRLSGNLSESERHNTTGQLAVAAHESVSPLERLEASLNPWVAFVIMPIFALANAGVQADPTKLTHPVAIAVAAGLILGKPLGIFVFSWLAVKMRIASLPRGVTWKVLLGAGCLGGIGFTMSLFIASLALEGDLLEAGKVGTLCGSAISAVLGMTLLVIFLPKPGQTDTGPTDIADPDPVLGAKAMTDPPASAVEGKH